MTKPRRKRCRLTRLTLFIKAVTPSLNQYRKMHWGTRRRLRPRLAWLVKAAMSDVLLVHGEDDVRTFLAHRMHVRLTSHRRRGHPPLDDDNLVGGAKPLRDALVDCGLIHDDSAVYAEFEYEQVADGGVYTTIELEPAREVKRPSSKSSK